MSLEQSVTLAVNGLGLYLALGLLFGLYFILAGVQKLDPVAREGTKGFRILILPGAVALWPLLLWRLLQKRSRPPEENNPHRVAARRAP